MPLNITTTRIREFGAPRDVLRLETTKLPEPAGHEVIVAVQASPINPADINIIEGKYGKLPRLPFVPGNEGIGIVMQAGNEVTNLAIEQHVVNPTEIGAWCEAYAVDSRKLTVVPSDIDIEQAAMLSVNPTTAWLLLENFVKLQAGEWLIQNAANSAVGRLIIQIAKQRGLKTINIVRDVGRASDLEGLGATKVMTIESATPKEIRRVTGESGIPLGLNAVGGAAASAVVKCLAPGGTMVTYGAMGREPVTVSNPSLIFKDIRIRGFWRSAWFSSASRSEIQELFDGLIHLIRGKKLYNPIEQTYPLTRIQDAVQHAQEPRRAGKILIKAS